MRNLTSSIRGILVLTIGALTLLIAVLAARDVVVNWDRLIQIRALKDASDLSDQLFDAVDKLSVERDVALSMLRTSDANTVASLRPRLEESRRATDAAFNTAMMAIERYSYPGLADVHNEIASHLPVIQALRPRIDAAIDMPRAQRDSTLPARWTGEVTALTEQTQTMWVGFIKHFTGIDPFATQHLQFKQFLYTIMDFSARERSLIGQLIAENVNPTPAETAQLLRGQGTIELSWQMSRVLADQSGLYPAIARFYSDASSQYATMHDMMENIFYVPQGQHGATYPIGVDLWLELSNQASDSMGALRDAALVATRAHVESLLTDTERNIALQAGILVLALGLCGLGFSIIDRRVMRPVNGIVDALVKATKGEDVAFSVPDGRQDEIGKLANVLHAFQETVMVVRRTAAELDRDITLRKETERELVRHARALERSNKELDDFAYIASHDLKEPLRGIHNHSRFLLEDNEGKLDKESVNRLNRLVYLTQRMERLVNDLLYFSRLGRQELAIQPTDLNAVIADIKSRLEQFLDERAARIVMPAPLPTIVCDKPRIAELFHNLITNAAKYNDAKEKTIEIGCLAQYPAPGMTMAHDVFYVKDNGLGIDREFHDDIFRIFRRLQRTAETEDGTGVGLTFVKKIVERHGGKIWLNSEPGEGTTFYFTLEMVHHDQEHDPKVAA